MKKLTTDQVRNLFLEYFKQHDHMIEPGASLVPINDPTLLWINSGVAALKKYFDGSITPLNPRIANAQKAIRTNDIENVGKTARHHTFFEMLGNFSIGDYFKKEAIFYAWDFLTNEKWIGFDPKKLYVSIHPDDHEAYDIWTKKIGFPEKKILKTEDNFWQIGEGPSGPNTEIFYDRGEAYDPDGVGEKLFFEELENDRYIEIWNVVFSQYDAKEGVERKDFKELPQKNIDTGMGLERLTCIIQDVETNFDIDCFLPIIEATASQAKYPYEGEYKMSYRVIADHLRTVTFALSDGAVFSNDGRGYVLRRLLRRAVRYGIKLGINQAFMYRLVTVVAKAMHDFYPYLEDKVEFVSKLVKLEEERFHLTLADGEKLLAEVLENNQDSIISGDVVFKLYDTFGFPYELTEEIAQEKGFSIDKVGFDEAMAAQRERARSARDQQESMSSQSIDLMNFKAPFEFLGYTTTITEEATITGLFKDGEAVDTLVDEGLIAVDISPFYAESGGQIADTGSIVSFKAKAQVTDVQKAPHKQHLHHVTISEGSFSVGDKVELVVDDLRRMRIKANHSAVHLLQSALIKVVGSHIAQAGSYVADNYARFDFTHFEKVTTSELQEVEKLVNDYIFSQLPVTHSLMSLNEAKEKGALALFDEKYGDQVRVISMGEVSIELCGGTHVSNTQEVGFFKISSEESIGSGIRRINFHTKFDAYDLVLEEEELLNSLANDLKINSVSLVSSKVHQLQEELLDTKEELTKLSSKLLLLESSEMINEFGSKGDLNVLVKEFTNVSSNDLKSLIDNLKVRVDNALIFFMSIVDDKIIFVAYCSEKAISQGYNAGVLVKEAASISGGNGGGRADLAQAGGKDLTKSTEALATIRQKLL